MNEEEIRLFEEKLKSIPNIDSMKPPITSMDSIDINELINVVKRFKCLPSKTTLIESNNSLNWQVEKLEEENQKLIELANNRYKYASEMEGKYILEKTKLDQLRSWLEEETKKGGSSIDLSIRIHTLQEVLNRLEGKND